jgi:hydroxymethylpyrimidine/phosphomethylpyrimidine kinase
MKPPRILIIAGSDSGGGAGLQADIKTVTVLGGFAMTAVTAITVQNTLGVHGVHPVPLNIIHDQIACVLQDIGADIIKIGMLGNAAITHTVVDALAAPIARDIPMVLDPVMQAKGGAALLTDDAVQALVERLLPRAALVTPNIPEAETLSGMSITTVTQMQEAAQRIAAYGVPAVLVKGGHLSEAALHNVLYADGKMQVFTHERIASRHTHGTGCTLASALAVSLAQGMTLQESVARAEAYVRGAILHAPEYGAGHGAMHHGWCVKT